MKILQISSGKENFDEIMLQPNYRKQNFMQILVNNLDESKSEDDHFEIVSKILEWISQNTNCCQKMIQSMDENGETLQYYFARKFKAKIVEVLKLLKNILKSTDFLYHKNFRNVNFIRYYRFGSANNVTTEILDWLKENNEIYLTNFITDFAIDSSYNLIDQICIYTPRTIDIPKEIKDVITWLDLNVPDFNKKEFLSRFDTSARGNIFLELIFDRNSDEEMIQALLDVMSWMNEMKIYFLNEFLHKSSCCHVFIFHYLCEKFISQKELLARIIIEIIRWIKLNAPHFELNSVLSHKDFYGHTFLARIAMLHDMYKGAESAIVKVLKFFNEFDKNMLKKTIEETDLIGQFSSDGYLLWAYKNENVLKTVDSWIKNNVK